MTRSLRRRGSAVVAVAAATVLVTSGITYADTLQDNIDDDGAGITLVAGSNTGAVGSIRVVGNSAQGDPDPGCNIDPKEDPLVLDLVMPVGITASSDPLTITSCGNDFPVTFKAGPNAVSGTVTAAIISEPAGGGTYDNKVSIPITVTQPAAVTPPPNTAPTVAVTGVTDGATYRVGSVPTPGCSVEDAEDTNESATPSITNGAYDALGSRTVTCSYTDGGGLSATRSATYTVLRALDTTAPVITHTLTDVDGADGWHQGDVTLDWTVTEAESPETLETTGCDDVRVTEDQAARTYTCSATSEGGGPASASVTIKRDGTAPTVTYGTVTQGDEGLDGWYTSDVTVRFDATDAVSGVSPSSETATTSGEGTNLTVASPEFTDNAGNTRAAGAVTSSAYKVDKTGPEDITFTGVPTAPVPFGSVPSSFTCAATDTVSGMAGCVVTGAGSAVGTHTLTATATDNAGNTSTATTTYTVLPWTTKGFYAPVDMSTAATKVYNTVKGGSTVPLKFELFAGSTELTETSAVAGFSAVKVSCVSGSTEDAIETLASTGGTSLRYDTTGGQFIQNWKTPTTAGLCYRATMTAADGSKIEAFFKIK